MRKLLGFLPAFGLFLGLSQVASAAEVTRVASSFDEDNAFDFHFGVSYEFDYKKAAILREWSNGQDNRLARDLVYKQRRQTVSPMMEIGLWHDLSVYVTLPIVIADNRDYSFDQEEGSDCVYPEPGPGNPGQATCVNKTNSTSIRDAIIPRDGFDAFEEANPFGQFTDPDTARIFRSPTRRGLDQIHVGMKIGLLSQQRRSHLPHWVIGLEGRFAIAKPMKFTRDISTSDPEANHRVGRGIHELGVWTSLSRRYRFLEPFFGAHWRYAMRAGSTEFQSFNSNGTQGKTNPQSETGAYFGAEIVPWENDAKRQKMSIMLSGSAILHYNGRGYSEVWELLADSPALAGTNAPGQSECNTGAAIANAAANPLDPTGYLDAANSATNSGGCEVYSGITTLQDYGTFGLNAALNFHLSEYARLNFGARMQTDTRHFVTAASRGSGDLAGEPDIVDPDTIDVNPIRRDVVDNVGRRYAVDDVFQVIGFANFIVTF